MASGPAVGDGGEGDGDITNRRFMEIKVYTRRAFRGQKNKSNNNNDASITVVTSIATATTTIASSTSTVDDNNTSNNGDNKNDNTSAANSDNNNENDKNGILNTDNNSSQPLLRTSASENGISTQQLLISRLDVASDDSSNFNRQQVTVETAVPGAPDVPSESGAVKTIPEDQIDSTSKSKQDTRELRRKLESELELVRTLVNKIDMKQGELRRYGRSNVTAKDGTDNGGVLKRLNSDVSSVAVPRKAIRLFHQLSISLTENNHGVGDSMEKEKRTPKANQFYSNSEFLLAKDKFPPAESNKKSKSNGKKRGGGERGHGFGMGTKFFKNCASLLEKLMKHKHGWVFNDPVDVEGLGLHDYFIIIKHPMDLGTVKSRLNKNWYKSLKEFAEDVRLTFHNAMTYNPKGQDVYVMAEQLLMIFEERWAIIESEYIREMMFGLDYGYTLPTHIARNALPPRRQHAVDKRPKPMSTTSVRTPAPRKPKAKDIDKRDMTYEEKQKLSTNLQGLPSEKLDAIVQIIKKQTKALHQRDDEIEVDIDSVDVETLWELDRFVTNYKKNLSKKKRKAELLKARMESDHNVLKKTQVLAVAESPKQTNTGERQEGSRSRSSSSSSSSSSSGSSSSDSDSDSSSSSSGSDAGSPRT